MRYYVVDAFADRVFEGNPAAVCVLDAWPNDTLMQNIAAENNLSETAFAVRGSDGYHLRWFTPSQEIDLCGHATLATAFVVLQFVEPQADHVVFDTLSGRLSVVRQDDRYEMDFPSYDLAPIAVSDLMADVIGTRPREAWLGRDLVAVVDDPEMVRRATPDLVKACDLPGVLLHVSAPGRKTDSGSAVAADEVFDCVSRSFAPKVGIDEDPVCGSGHCHIAPLWAAKLGRSSLIARQASKRGGTLYCTVDGDRTRLAGRAVLYATGEIQV